MAESCLMASSTYSPWRFEQGFYKTSKELQPCLTSHAARKDILSSDSLHLKLSKLKDNTWESRDSILQFGQGIKLNSVVREPVLSDLQGAPPDLVLFSFGIAEKCTNHEKIMKLLMSGASDSEKEELDASSLAMLMEQHKLAMNDPQQSLLSSDVLYEASGVKFQPCLLYPRSESDLHEPILEFKQDLADSSKVVCHRSGQILFSGTRAEMNDLLAVAAEFYLSTNSTRSRNLSMLVPHFTRVETSEARANIADSSLKLENVMVAPLKSPSKIKLKSPPKKKTSGKAVSERDLYRRNYFHACESLLSLIVDKRHGKTAILSLKKSGPELSLLLTQFSAGIAGTGLAVLFSVACKLASGRVPFCASKLLNTGLGFGLVWLSWAVNKLRDTILSAAKKSSKLALKEEEVMQEVDRSVNEIFFRSATLLAVFVLRFA